MAGMRFTTWLGEDERDALRTVARENHVSENMVARIALRSLLLGEPVPGWLQRTTGDKPHVQANR